MFGSGIKQTGRAYGVRANGLRLTWTLNFLDVAFKSHQFYIEFRLLRQRQKIVLFFINDNFLNDLEPFANEYKILQLRNEIMIFKFTTLSI